MKLHISKYGLQYKTPRKVELPEAHQVMACMAWIILFTTKTKTIRPTRSSYGYKHGVENATGIYISNGAFIEAARRTGYNMTQIRGGPNAHFNMSLQRGYDMYNKKVVR